MNCNNVLRQITYDIYKHRPAMLKNMRTNYRIERVNGGLLCDLWFLTVGCMHDAQGGCVMCNYGKGNGKAAWGDILEELRKIVQELPWEFEDFLLTPSGSMLDEREVSSSMREDLVSVLKNIKAKHFIIETRADTITDSGMDFLKRIMPDAEKYIEIGLESSDDWILKYCINKNAAYRDFKDAVKKIHDNGIFVTANIGLGYPFMSERAAISETIRSVRVALDEGVDSIVLFPYHIKKGTLLDVMYQQGMYDCVSLWALVDVLSSFSKEELDKIQISWYKDYFGEKRSYIYRSPGTCQKCAVEVMEALDHYRDTQDYDSLIRLTEHFCGCWDEWKKKLQSQPAEIQIENVKENYRRLADIFAVDKESLERELFIMEQDYSMRR